MCHNKFLDEVQSATKVHISYYFLCLCATFKCHKERCEVPHVAQVLLFGEACNLTLGNDFYTTYWLVMYILILIGQFHNASLVCTTLPMAWTYSSIQIGFLTLPLIVINLLIARLLERKVLNENSGPVIGSPHAHIQPYRSHMQVERPFLTTYYLNFCHFSHPFCPPPMPPIIMVGKNVEIRKLLPGKCDHLVGNFVFFNKEIHKK